MRQIIASSHYRKHYSVYVYVYIYVIIFDTTGSSVQAFLMNRHNIKGNRKNCLPGTIQSSIDAIKLVNIRRDFASTAILTIASILDNHAVTHHNAADEAKGKLKNIYEEQVSTTQHTTVYSYQDAKDLAANVIEQECATLHKRLQNEELCLLKCPDTDSTCTGQHHQLEPSGPKHSDYYTESCLPSTTQTTSVGGRFSSGPFSGLFRHGKIGQAN